MKIRESQRMGKTNREKICFRIILVTCLDPIMVIGPLVVKKVSFPSSEGNGGKARSGEMVMLSHC